MPLFTIYDCKAHSFGNPFISTNLLTAKRDFERASNDPNSVICSNPEDFTLYELGDFDSCTGNITVEPTAINHGLATQFRR